MKYLKSFENNIVQKEQNIYKVYQQELLGNMLKYFRENVEIDKGSNEYEIVIQYSFEAYGGNNPEDIQDAKNFLENLPGVFSVVHKMGHKFEVEFEDPVELY